MSNIVITMGGLGSRFRNAGYDVPKYEIVAHGKSLFEWSLLSLSAYFRQSYRLSFVALEETQPTKFINEQCAKLGIKPADVVLLDELTDGQATSAVRGIEGDLSDPSELVIYNIDTFIFPGELKAHQPRPGSEGWIPCFNVPGDHWSFAKVDETGWVCDVAEKTRISDNASVGLYWFKSAQDYLDLYNEHFANGQGSVRGERYIAPMYSTLLKRGGKVSMSILSKDAVIGLGTPDELHSFERMDGELISQKLLGDRAE